MRDFNAKGFASQWNIGFTFFFLNRGHSKIPSLYKPSFKHLDCPDLFEKRGTNWQLTVLPHCTSCILWVLILHAPNSLVRMFIYMRSDHQMALLISLQGLRVYRPLRLSAPPPPSGHCLLEGRYPLSKYRPCFSALSAHQLLLPPHIFEGHRPPPSKTIFNRTLPTKVI